MAENISPLPEIEVRGKSFLLYNVAIPIDIGKIVESMDNGVEFLQTGSIYLLDKQRYQGIMNSLNGTARKGFFSDEKSFISAISNLGISGRDWLSLASVFVNPFSGEVPDENSNMSEIYYYPHLHIDFALERLDQRDNEFVQSVIKGFGFSNTDIALQSVSRRSILHAIEQLENSSHFILNNPEVFLDSNILRATQNAIVSLTNGNGDYLNVPISMSLLGDVTESSSKARISADKVLNILVGDNFEEINRMYEPTEVLITGVYHNQS